MKTIIYVSLAVMLACYPSIKSPAQSESVQFCETYTQQEVLAKLEPGDRFFKLINTANTDPESSRIGRCMESDLESLWEYVQSDPFKEKVQADLFFAPGYAARDQLISIYAIRKRSPNEVFPMSHDLEEVSVSKSENEENYALLITFSDSGAVTWASMTRLNKGRDIAMLHAGKVISAPRVTEEIKHGKCMISGKFTESEIYSLKSSLQD